MNYTVIKKSETECDVADMVHGIEIQIGLSKKKTDEICRKLNMGAGFYRSPIPSFIASKYG